MGIRKGELMNPWESIQGEDKIARVTVMNAMVSSGSPFQDWGTHSLRYQKCLLLMTHLWKEMPCISLQLLSGDSPHPVVTGKSKKINVQLTSLKVKWILRAILHPELPVSRAEVFAANVSQFNFLLCPASFPCIYWSQKHSPKSYLHTSLRLRFLYLGTWFMAIISYVLNFRLQRWVEEECTKGVTKLIYQNRL